MVIAIEGMFLRVISTTIAVAVLVAASVMPYLGLQGNGARSSKRSPPSGRLGLFTCFSCGIFLSTCFLGLIPHLRVSEAALKSHLNSTNPELFSQTSLFLDSNLLILVGFALIVLVEQSVVFCLPSPKPTSNKSRKPIDKNETETTLADRADNQPLVKLNSGSDTDSETEDLGKIEFRSNPDTEHGHSHSHQFIPNGSMIQSTILLFALSVHSIFEGIALGAQTDDSAFLKFLISIMLHEVLCSFAYGVKLSKGNVSIKVGLASILFLSATLPIGMSIMAFLASGEQLTALFFKFLLESIAAGTFIYVACIEMLADELHHSSAGFSKGLALCAGIVVFFVFNYLFHV